MVDMEINDTVPDILEFSNKIDNITLSQVCEEVENEEYNMISSPRIKSAKTPRQTLDGPSACGENGGRSKMDFQLLFGNIIPELSKIDAACTDFWLQRFLIEV